MLEVKIKVFQKFFVTKIQNPGGSSLTKVLTRDCLSLLYSAHCTLQAAHCKLLTAHCTLYTIHRTMNTTNCTLRTENSTELMNLSNVSSKLHSQLLQLEFWTGQMQFQHGFQFWLNKWVETLSMFPLLSSNCFGAGTFKYFYANQMS